mmetsp:Transcript_42318/g.64909  ORF Transcript_42318/g.64909 Transcript_42318/m.64909 type:complete len:81 (-) Transcript_42318:725-967(-)
MQRNSCLPWTWIYAVWMQLSILLPFFLYFATRYWRVAKAIIISTLIGIIIWKIIAIKAIVSSFNAHGLSLAGLTNPARNF